MIKPIILSIGVSLGILIIIFGIVATTFGLRVATVGIFGRGEAHIQTQSAAFRLQAYESFFNQCASVQGLEGQIDELTAQLALHTPGTRSYDYALSALTGTKGLRHTAIAKYNQDALKWTVGQFRDNELPYQLLDSNYPEEGAKTICALQ